MHPITFPGLGLVFDFNNIAFSIGGKDIYWYGIIITCGLLLALLLAKKDKQKYGLLWDDITSFLCYALVFGFIGARIYYVTFQWDYYSQHLDEMIKIWHGRNCHLWWYHWSISHSDCVLLQEKNIFIISL